MGFLSDGIDVTDFYGYTPNYSGWAIAPSGVGVGPLAG